MKIFVFPLLLLTASNAGAVLPMNGFYSLVAGRGDEGYHDGSFAEAQFHSPIGLALNGDGTQLYVSDAGNHRIRQVDLAHRDQVTTLAGTDKMVPKDGSLHQACFNQPGLMVWLPSNQLIVYDKAAQSLRVINIGRREVRTLLSGKELAGVEDLAYEAQSNSLFLAQPHDHLLRKIDLSKSHPELIQIDLTEAKEITMPLCLCADEGRVYVSDEKTSAVYSLEFKASQTQPEVHLVAHGKKITDLAVSGHQLYALQADEEPFVKLNPYQVIDPPLVWDSPAFWDRMNWDDPAGWKPNTHFVERSDWFSPGHRSVLISAESSRPGNFYFVVGSRNEIVSIQDSTYKDLGNRDSEEGLLTYGYSYAKPPQTKRLLVVADRDVLHAESLMETASEEFPNTVANDQLSMALRMNLVLNTRSSLVNRSLTYEVFGLEAGQSVKKGLIDELIRKYNIDQVLLVETGEPHTNLSPDWLKTVLPSSGSGNKTSHVAGIFLPGIGPTASGDSITNEAFWKKYFTDEGYAFWDLTEAWTALKATYFPIGSEKTAASSLIRRMWLRWIHGRESFSSFWTVLKAVCLSGFDHDHTPRLSARGRLLLSWLLAHETLKHEASTSLSPSQSDRMLPIHLYQDLTAGEGTPGNLNGSFAKALFHQPLALAMNGAGNELYVADSLNHQVRRIFLDQQNKVETLAGSGAEGNRDGAFYEAEFQKPDLLASTEKGLLVFDSQDLSFRVLDFKTKRVSTLTPQVGGKAVPKEQFRSVFAMVYEPSEGVLYVTNPNQGRLEKISLNSGNVTVVLERDARIPQPGALCLYQGHLCAADRTLSGVYQISFAKDKTQLTLLGKSDKTLAMASCKEKLYAVKGPPLNWVRIIPADDELSVSVMSSYRKPVAFHFDDFEGNPSAMTGSIGFVSDPDDERQFYVSAPGLNQIFCVHDFEFGKYMTREAFPANLANADGIRDWQYADKKAKKCCRILVVGDSHIYRNGEGVNGLESISNRLELFLNTEAALDGIDIQYQVFNFGIPNSDDVPPYYWPAFLVPDIVKKYDVDQVLLCFNAETNDSNLAPFFQRPLGPDGVPLWQKDTEFLLKPPGERYGSGGRINELIKRNIGPKGGHISFRELISRPRDRVDLAYAFSRPIVKLKQELGDINQKEKKKIGLHIFYFASGPLGFYSLVEPNRTLWAEVADDAKLSFSDLSDGYIALRQDYFPAAEKFNTLHPTANGFSLKSLLLSNELIKRRWIPWK